eukprot:5576631-Pleurochrysis_carterae.AAC.3
MHIALQLPVTSAHSQVRAPFASVVTCFAFIARMLRLTFFDVLEGASRRASSVSCLQHVSRLGALYANRPSDDVHTRRWRLGHGLGLERLALVPREDLLDRRVALDHLGVVVARVVRDHLNRDRLARLHRRHRRRVQIIVAPPHRVLGGGEVVVSAARSRWKARKGLRALEGQREGGHLVDHPAARAQEQAGYGVYGPKQPLGEGPSFSEEKAYILLPAGSETTAGRVVKRLVNEAVSSSIASVIYCFRNECTATLTCKIANEESTSKPLTNVRHAKQTPGENGNWVV